MIFLRNKNEKILFIIAAVSWFILVCITCLHTENQLTDVVYDIWAFFKNLALITLTVTTFGYIRSIETTSKRPFNEGIWNLFIIATTTYCGLFISKESHNFLDTSIRSNPFYIDLVYHLNILLFCIFSGKCFYTFKSMVLYQKTKKLNILWNLFEWAVIATLLFSFFPLSSLTPYVYYIIGAISLYGFSLALHMQWVAYLNFKQKWKTILLLLIVLLIATSFIEYIYNIQDQREQGLFDTLDNHLLFNDLGEKVFTIIIFIYIIFFCIASLLVILFNLPTTSVFEQKFDEVLNIQKLSDSLQFTDSINEIYENFLNIAFVSTGAKACWLEVFDERDTSIKQFKEIGVDKYEVFELKRELKYFNQQTTEKPLHIKDLKNSMGRHTQTKFRSLLLIPLYSQKIKKGVVVLLKDVKDGFNQNDINLSNTLSNQASIAITNSTLLNEALETANYQKEIRIAHEVKSKLLTTPELRTKELLVSAKYSSPEHIGGDFYSLGSFDDNHHYIAIADVAGHGTSAAFNMALLKGIFEGTIQLQLPLKELLEKINTALSNCIDNKTYVSMSIVYINTATKQFQIGRAGHHATLHFKTKENTVDEIKDAGLGLGILRNSDFSQHLEVSNRTYDIGDSLFLYTDGLVEAKNIEGMQYGLGNIKEEFHLQARKSPKEVVENAYNKMKHFVKTVPVDDDVTCLTVKFLN